MERIYLGLPDAALCRSLGGVIITGVGRGVRGGIITTGVTGATGGPTPGTAEPSRTAIIGAGTIRSPRSAPDGSSPAPAASPPRKAGPCSGQAVQPRADGGRGRHAKSRTARRTARPDAVPPGRPFRTGPCRHRAAAPAPAGAGRAAAAAGGGSRRRATGTTGMAGWRGRRRRGRLWRGRRHQPSARDHVGGGGSRRHRGPGRPDASAIGGISMFGG